MSNVPADSIPGAIHQDPWYRRPLRASRQERNNANQTRAQPVSSELEMTDLADIEVEDYGFDYFEIEPSTKRQQYLEEIVALKDTISNWEIPKYIDDFEEAKNTESLLIGAVSLDELEDHEETLELERLREQEEQAMAHARKQAELTRIEKDARSRLQEIWEKHSREAAARELMRVDAHDKRKQFMKKAFEKAEENLRVALERREAEVTTYYGDLNSSAVQNQTTVAENLMQKLKGRHFKLDWVPYQHTAVTR